MVGGGGPVRRGPDQRLYSLQRYLTIVTVGFPCGAASRVVSGSCPRERRWEAALAKAGVTDMTSVLIYAVVGGVGRGR